MAVHAADFAARHLGVEPRDADLSASQVHHAAGLLADVVELEHARIPLGAVDTARRDERGDDMTDVALLGLRAPRTRWPLEIEPPPADP